jgi:hypothetical protein
MHLYIIDIIKMVLRVMRVAVSSMRSNTPRSHTPQHPPKRQTPITDQPPAHNTQTQRPSSAGGRGSASGFGGLSPCFLIRQHVVSNLYDRYVS